jgi:hypothetical protein
MYRIYPAKILVAALVWLALGINLLFVHAQDLVSFRSGPGTVATAVWLLLNLLFWGPIWRRVWKRIPALERAVFPDLNGTWDVELTSNWSRQEQMLEAAARNTPKIDMRICDEQLLAPLRTVHLRAEITQTLWKFEMKLHSPSAATPIKRSDTLIVEPERGVGLKPPTISYFYKQENNTANVADDPEFYGAARLHYDFETRTLEGLSWTARKWQRAINTAASLRMTRI